jgi:hypothetical protein
VNEKILVSLSFEEINAIQKTLQSCPEFNFVSFRLSVQKVHTQSDINRHPAAKVDFDKSLSRCQGAILNAGFELASECFQLNKRSALKPLLGQF